MANDYFGGGGYISDETLGRMGQYSPEAILQAANNSRPNAGSAFEALLKHASNLPPRLPGGYTNLAPRSGPVAPPQLPFQASTEPFQLGGFGIKNPYFPTSPIPRDFVAPTVPSRGPEAPYVPPAFTLPPWAVGGSGPNPPSYDPRVPSAPAGPYPNIPSSPIPRDLGGFGIKNPYVPLAPRSAPITNPYAPNQAFAKFRNGPDNQGTGEGDGGTGGGDGGTGGGTSGEPPPPPPPPPDVATPGGQTQLPPRPTPGSRASDVKDPKEFAWHARNSGLQGFGTTDARRFAESGFGGSVTQWWQNVANRKPTAGSGAGDVRDPAEFAWHAVNAGLTGFTAEDANRFKTSGWGGSVADWWEDPKNRPQAVVPPTVVPPPVVPPPVVPPPVVPPPGAPVVPPPPVAPPPPRPPGPGGPSGSDYLESLNRALQTSQDREQQNALRSFRSAAGAVGLQDTGAYLPGQADLIGELSSRFGQQRAEALLATSEAERNRAFQGSQNELNREMERYGIDVNSYTSRFNTTTQAGVQQAAQQMQYDLGLRGIQMDQKRLEEVIRGNTMGYNLDVNRMANDRDLAGQRNQIDLFDLIGRYGPESIFGSLFGPQGAPGYQPYIR